MRSDQGGIKVSQDKSRRDPITITKMQLNNGGVKCIVQDVEPKMTIMLSNALNAEPSFSKYPSQLFQ